MQRRKNYGQVTVERAWVRVSIGQLAACPKRLRALLKAETLTIITGGFGIIWGQTMRFRVLGFCISLRGAVHNWNTVGVGFYLLYFAGNRLKPK